MKNKLFIPIFILFSFFFINNVNAKNLIYDYNTTYSGRWFSQEQLTTANYIINYMNTNYPDSRFVVSDYSSSNTNSTRNDRISLTTFVPESERGSYFFGVYTGTDTYSDVRVGIYYSDTLEGISQQGYLVPSNNVKLYNSNGSIYCLLSDTKQQCEDRLSSLITFNSYNTYSTALYQSLGTYLNLQTNYNNLYGLYPDYGGSTPSSFLVDNLRGIIYSSFDIPITLVDYSSTPTFMPLVFKYNDTEITSNKLDKFYTYYDMVNIPTIPDNTITDFGNNSYGVKSNNVEIINSLGNSVNCVKDRDFDNNGYCTFYYDDFGENEDPSILTSDFDISFSFDNNSSTFPLISDKYYVFTYRTIADINVVPTLVMGYSGNATIPIVIDDIKITNNGLNKDYQLILHTNNSDVNFALDSIKIFNISLNGYSNSLSDFKLGVYNSYKYTQYDTMPTQQELTSDLNNNSLNTINLGTTDNFFSKFSVNDHGLSTFITAPIRLFQALRNTTCETIILPVPHLGNIQLPCISSLFQQNLPDLFNIYQLIMSGIICYYIGLNYFRIVKNAFNPEDDRIEVQDL